MIELIIVFSLVIIAGIYLFKKMYTTFTKPTSTCSNCSGCNFVDKCDVK